MENGSSYPLSTCFSSNVRLYHRVSEIYRGRYVPFGPLASLTSPADLYQYHLVKHECKLNPCGGKQTYGSCEAKQLG